MRRELQPVRKAGGVLRVPGDKSIAHRAALLSILCSEPLTARNYPQNADCTSSLHAAEKLGVRISRPSDDTVVLTPPNRIAVEPETIIDCGNSGTTARLLSGLVAGYEGVSIILSGDESLSRRPMKRIVKPLTEMGAELTATEDHLPLTVRGRKLLPFEYRLPIASAQLKSSLLLAGLSSGCSISVEETQLSRDHTELMVGQLGGTIDIEDVKPVVEPDPRDPRKKRRVMPKPYKRRSNLSSAGRLKGGDIDIPGDMSTAAFFLAVAAISGRSVTVDRVGLNPTRTAFLDHLRAIGCKVEIVDKEIVTGEARGTVTVCGAPLKARRISGETTVGLIDEVPMVAVLAAFADGSTIIRDAGELRVKESDRLAAVAHNIVAMGVSCGALEDGLIIEGGKQPSGADFKSFGDHRIAMAFSVAAMFAVGPSSLDDDSVVGISCPNFYELMEQITR